jgi:hypothetical protein
VAHTTRCRAALAGQLAGRPQALAAGAHWPRRPAHPIHGAALPRLGCSACSRPLAAAGQRQPPCPAPPCTPTCGDQVAQTVLQRLSAGTTNFCRTPTPRWRTPRATSASSSAADRYCTWLSARGACDAGQCKAGSSWGGAGRVGPGGVGRGHGAEHESRPAAESPAPAAGAWAGRGGAAGRRRWCDSEAVPRRAALTCCTSAWGSKAASSCCW